MSVTLSPPSYEEVVRSTPVNTYINMVSFCVQKCPNDVQDFSFLAKNYFSLCDSSLSIYVMSSLLYIHRFCCHYFNIYSYILQNLPFYIVFTRGRFVLRFFQNLCNSIFNQVFILYPLFVHRSYKFRNDIRKLQFIEKSLS